MMSDTGMPVSVAIACHNDAEHVAKAIESALTQVPPPSEVVVCDDGSTDASARVLSGFGNQIRVVRHDRARGESAAKNAAVRTASSDIVVLLDADDEFLPGRVHAIMTAFLDNPDADIVTTDAYLCYRGRSIGTWYGPSHRPPGDDQRTAVLARNPVFGHAGVRRAAYLAVGGFDESIRHAADWDCWIRMVLAGSRIVVVERPLARYRLHGGNASANRVAMLSCAVQFLTRTAERGDLSARERDVALATAAARRAILAREELKALLLAGDSRAARACARAVMSHRGQPRRSRAIALVVMLLPRPAGVVMRIRDRYWWTGPGGVRLRR